MCARRQNSSEGKREREEKLLCTTTSGKKNRYGCYLPYEMKILGLNVYGFFALYPPKETKSRG